MGGSGAPATASVAFLGPLGTFSHQAVHALFDGCNVALRPQPSIRGAIDDAAAGAPHALVVFPVENSAQGRVREAVAALASGPFAPQHGLCIVDELRLPVAHALIVPGHASGSPRDEALRHIAVVRSHPQALAQCSRFLDERLSQARRDAVRSTAQAVTMLKDAPPEPLEAAVASELAATLVGAHVLQPQIQNANDNRTRFLVAAADPDHPAVAPILKQSRECRRLQSTSFRAFFRISMQTPANDVISVCEELASAAHSAAACAATPLHVVNERDAMDPFSDPDNASASYFVLELGGVHPDILLAKYGRALAEVPALSEFARYLEADLEHRSVKCFCLGAYPVAHEIPNLRASL